MDSYKITERLRNISDTLIINADFLDNIGLLNGKTGIAIFFFHMAQATGNKIYGDYAGKLVDQICESLHQDLSPLYGNGLSGIGIGFEYMIKQRFIDGDADDVLSDIDNVMHHHTSHHLSSLLETSKGITGIGRYYIGRLTNKMGNNANQKSLFNIVDILSCPYQTYSELYSVIHFLSGVVPLGINTTKTLSYLNYAVDKMETMVYEDVHFRIYPGEFNPLIAATLLCQAAEKTGILEFYQKAKHYIQSYEPEFRYLLENPTLYNAAKYSFLYGFLGRKLLIPDLESLSQKWLETFLIKEFEPSISMGLANGYAGMGMYLLLMNNEHGGYWTDIFPCHINMN